VLVIIGSAIFIGLSLGLLGAGGSIITVPLLAYLVGFSEKEAIIGALFIVACISGATALMNARNGRIHIKSAAWLSITGIIGSSLATQLSNLISGEIQFVLLSVVMLFAGWRMLKGQSSHTDLQNASRLRLTNVGIGLGGLTGLVGVGGGFLIVPALVTMLHIPMKLAVPTSLTIIFFNAGAGFASHFMTNSALVSSLNWSILLIFTGVGIAGSFIGQSIANKLPQKHLKKGFAMLILVIAIGVLFHAISQLIIGL